MSPTPASTRQSMWSATITPSVATSAQIGGVINFQQWNKSHDIHYFLWFILVSWMVNALVSTAKERGSPPQTTKADTTSKKSGPRLLNIEALREEGCTGRPTAANSSEINFTSLGIAPLEDHSSSYSKVECWVALGGLPLVLQKLSKGIPKSGRMKRVQWCWVELQQTETTKASFSRADPSSTYMANLGLGILVFPSLSLINALSSKHLVRGSSWVFCTR